MRRRDFLKQASSALLVLSCGDILSFTGHPDELAKKTVLRFAVASDGHYGQKDTEYEKYFSEIVEHINQNHRQNSFDFCVINGDIIHDDKKWFPEAKKALDRLSVKYYVSQGNHDHVTPEEWYSAWNMPVNYDFNIKRNTVLIGTTSNKDGTLI
jgi:3',5'-cyclic-AMP phosphodiesterase